MVKDGQATCVIALSSDAIPAEKTAAAELAAYLRKISGAIVEIKSESDVAGRESVVYVGAGEWIRKLLPSVDFDHLKPDTIIIESVGNDLIFSGDRPRGTLYAVYSFLEDQLGVRWWTPDAEAVPSEKTIVIPRQNIRYAPPFAMREMATESTRESALFAARMKNNGHYQTQDASLGGHETILGFCHTFFTFLPPSKYFKDHPEWYSDKDNGNKPCTAQSKPVNDYNSELCLTNPEVIKEITKNITLWLRGHPHARIVSVSQMDNDNLCQCANCEALGKQEGSPSGPMIHFVNTVAELLEKEFPKVQVETLAYWYTLEPPLHVKPRHNVWIRLCTTGDLAYPLNTDVNEKFRDLLKRWSAVAPQIAIWDYTVGFRHLIYPFPNIQNFADNMRFFKKNNVVSVFEQGDYFTTGCGDFVQLRAWLLSKLMWNPDLDQDRLIKDFMTGYYGKAAPFLIDYIALMSKAVRQADRPLRWRPTEIHFLTLEIMNRANDLFDSAEKAVAGNTVQSDRVQRSRMPLDHAWIINYQALQEEAKEKKMVFKGPADIAAFVNHFSEKGEKFHTREFAENQAFPSYAANLSAQYLPPEPLPESIKPLIPAGVNPADVLTMSASQLRLLGGKTDNRPWAELVKDPVTGKKVTRMTGNHYEWAIQYTFDWKPIKKQKYAVYILVKIDADPQTPDNTRVLACGMHPGVNITPGEETLDYVTIYKTYGELKGKGFHLIPLGTHTIAGTGMMWVAPTKTPYVKYIYVDRMILIPQPE